MTKVGDLLKERLAKKLTVDDVAKATKLKAEYIREIESSNYDIGVSAIYLKGFIRRYASFLKLDMNVVEALYRRETGKEEKSADKIENKPVLGSRYLISPKLFYVFGSLVVLVLFIVFVSHQLLFLLSSPSLSLSSPVELDLQRKIGDQEIVDEVTATGSKIIVRGESQEGALIFINDTEVPVGEDNDFSQDVAITDGANQLIIKAENGFDRETTIKLNVVK